MMVYPTGLHRQLEIRRMRRMLGTAAAIVMSTPEAARRLVEAFPELRERRVIAIPNGYDAADFDGAATQAEVPSEKFRIVHTGYLHTAAGLRQRDRSFMRKLVGGGHPGVKILTRSHYFLLEAIERLLARDPTLRDRLELHLAGVISDVDRKLAERSGVAVLHGYMPHAESIDLMRSADLLFLPMQRLAPGRRSTTAPGKTYEYLASGRRILAAVPPGDARDLIAASGRGIICDPDDVDGLATAITVAMTDRAEVIRDDASVRRFSYEELAGEVASVVAGVVEVYSSGSSHQG
jgi:glycosyltransferase involved in cell wall biosynthesis